MFVLWQNQEIVKNQLPALQQPNFIAIFVYPIHEMSDCVFLVTKNTSCVSSEFPMTQDGTLRKWSARDEGQCAPCENSKLWHNVWAELFLEMAQVSFVAVPQRIDCHRVVGIKFLLRLCALFCCVVDATRKNVSRVVCL